MSDNNGFNLNDLRVILADEINKIRKGETSAANVNAVTNASGKIISSVKLEMEYYKLTGQTPYIAMMLPESRKGEESDEVVAG